MIIKIILVVEFIIDLLRIHLEITRIGIEKRSKFGERIGYKKVISDSTTQHIIMQTSICFIID